MSSQWAGQAAATFTVEWRDETGRHTQTFTDRAEANRFRLDLAAHGVANRFYETEGER